MFLSKRSEAPRKILSEIIEGEKTLSELSKAVEISKQAALKHLQALEEEGIITSNKKKQGGKQVRIFSLENYTSLTFADSSGYVVNFTADTSLDPRFPLAGQIPQKKFRRETIDYLEAVSNLEIQPLSILVFGSVARGEATWKSDIDAAFLTTEWTENSKNSVYERLSSVTLESEAERSLNPHFKTYETLESDDRVSEEIRSHGLLIYTTEKRDPTWKILKKYRSI